MHAQLLTIETILAPATRPLVTTHGVRDTEATKKEDERLDDGAQEDESQELSDLRVAHESLDQKDKRLENLLP